MQGVSKKVDNFEIALSTSQSNYDYQVFFINTDYLGTPNIQ